MEEKKVLEENETDKASGGEWNGHHICGSCGQEMKYLLELTGFEIVNVYGGYHKESGEGSAKNVIWCVKKV